MFCNKCGNKLKDGAVFCSQCGNSMIEAAPLAGASVKPPKAKKIPKPLLIGMISTVIIIAAALVVIPSVINGRRGITGNSKKIKISVMNHIKATGDSLEEHYKDKMVMGEYLWDYNTVDPKDITELHVGDVKSADLIPLKYCENLKYLNIMWSIKGDPGKLDLSPLKDLKNLECLTIWGGESEEHYYKISNLKPLGSIDSLIALSLHHCTITDVSGLERLTDLRFLNINEGYGSSIKIKDYSPLYELTNLGRTSSKLDKIRQWGWCPSGLKIEMPDADQGSFYGLLITNDNFSDNYEILYEKLPNANIMPPL